MTYTPDIPQPFDVLSTSQGQLLGNFQDLNTYFGTDHVTFNASSSNKGKHNKVTLVEQAANPDTTANQYALFSKETSAKTELWARPENNGTAYQLTKDGALYLRLLPLAAVNFNGSAVIQGSAVNVASVTTAAGIYTVNFTTAAPDSNYFWSIQAFATTGNFQLFGQLNEANAAYCKVGAYNTSVTLVTPARMSVVLWRFQ